MSMKSRFNLKFAAETACVQNDRVAMLILALPIRLKGTEQCERLESRVNLSLTPQSSHIRASGKTCPFAPTGGRIFFWCLCLCVLLVVSFYFGHCFSLRHKSCCKVDELLVESCV